MPGTAPRRCCSRRLLRTGQPGRSRSSTGARPRGQGRRRSPLRHPNRRVRPPATSRRDRRIGPSPRRRKPNSRRAHEGLLRRPGGPDDPAGAEHPGQLPGGGSHRTGACGHEDRLAGLEFANRRPAVHAVKPGMPTSPRRADGRTPSTSMRLTARSDSRACSRHPRPWPPTSPPAPDPRWTEDSLHGTTVHGLPELVWRDVGGRSVHAGPHVRIDGKHSVFDHHLAVGQIGQNRLDDGEVLVPRKLLRSPGESDLPGCPGHGFLLRCVRTARASGEPRRARPL